MLLQSRFRSELAERVIEFAASASRERTPVETGEARDGWKETGIERTEQAEASRRQLTNRVKHIVYLEDGTRRMRPRRMVKGSLAEAAARVPEFARELFRLELR
jgi:hypothetical protein